MDRALLGGGPRRGRLLDPKLAAVLLGCAACCAFVAEVVLNGEGGGEGRGELVSITSGKPVLAVPQVSRSEDPLSFDKADKVLRQIPVLGESIADGIKSATGHETRKVVPNAPKVRVDFYMEALCPGCQYFSTHVLNPVLKERGMLSLVDLNVVPAGNAELKPDPKTGKMEMVCQHGEEECEGNKIMLCMNEMLGRGSKQFLDTFDCMEKADPNSPQVSRIVSHNKTLSETYRMAKACMTVQGVDYEDVFACASSGEGERLAVLALNATQSLSPKYEYAPWVVVDGMPIKEDAYSLKEYVCNAYQGVLPHECSPALLKDYYPGAATLRGKAHASKLHGEERGGGQVRGHAVHTQVLSRREAFFQKCEP